MGHHSVLPPSASTPLTADPGGPGIFRSVVVTFLLCGYDPVLKRSKQTSQSTFSHPESSWMFDRSECSTCCGTFRPQCLPPANVCFPGQKCRPLAGNFPNQIRRACMSVFPASGSTRVCVCVCVPSALLVRASWGRSVLCSASWEQSCSASCRRCSPGDAEHLTFRSAGMKESIRQKWM